MRLFPLDEMLVEPPEIIPPRPAGPLFAIIVPTLDEAANIVPLLDALDRLLAGRRHEILVVDDWSQDGTPERVRAAAAGRSTVRLIRRYGRTGLSSAILEGALATTADVVAVLDADHQHDEAILPALLDLVAGGAADIAIGSRYVEGGGCAQWARERVAMSRVSTWIARRALPVDVADPMSGFFAMRADRLAELVPRLPGVGFKLLFDVLMASPRDLRVAEIPYVFRTRAEGASKLGLGVMADYGLSMVRGLIGRHLAARLAVYCLVGLLGVVVHLYVLRVLLGALHRPFYLAQTGAVLTAIGCNFALNNRLTFFDRALRGRRVLAGLASFYLICGTGALANVGVGSLLYADHERWWLAGLAGALVGSVWNFAVSSAVTWRRR